jgi:hypothetical protein
VRGAIPPIYAVMVWYSVKHRDNFNCTLTYLLTPFIDKFHLGYSSLMGLEVYFVILNNLRKIRNSVNLFLN